MAKALFILTSQNPDLVIEVGGARSWAVNVGRARQCEYVILAQNQHKSEYHSWAAPSEPHGQVFMVGKIGGIVPTTDPKSPPGRWHILFSEYAILSDPRLRWPGHRVPTYYTTLEDQDIDVAKLTFLPMPKRTDDAEVGVSGALASPADSVAKVESSPIHGPMLKAKMYLAKTLGVDVEAIEIVIRG